MENRKFLIGGLALRALGSTRHTDDTDYLTKLSSKEIFVHDKDANVDYVNANGHDLFKALYNAECKSNKTEIASPQTLLELKAFSFEQHCQNFNWQKVNSTEFDIKFLVIACGVDTLKFAHKHMSQGAIAEFYKVVESAKKWMNRK